MKTLKGFLALLAFAVFLFVSCSEKTQSLVDPITQESSITNLAKKGPIVHSVTGSGLLSTPEGKNLGARYAAQEFADGTFGGDYEINCANATGDPTMKWNGNVLSFTIYENIGQYNGTMAVFMGQEKTGPYADWYDVFFAIDNGEPGQASGPDQVNYFVVAAPTLEYVFSNGMTVEDFYTTAPADLISILGILDCERGNITVR